MELLGWVCLWLKLKRDTVQDILKHGRPKAKRLPAIDSKLKKLAGNTQPWQRNVANRIVKIARAIVNTVAFEQLVLGLVNGKSGLRKQLKEVKNLRVRLS